jgi:hypothetical protein
MSLDGKIACMKKNKDMTYKSIKPGMIKNKN